MRALISGLVAAAAVMTVSAAPAMACGGGLFQSCSPCGYVSRCGGYGGSYGYSNYNTGYYGVGYAGGYGGGSGGGYGYQTLPSQQYYYANQGPVYSGPGNFAPYPTYQESAVGYASGDGYGYNGGPYANATSHYGYNVGYQGGGYQGAGYGGGYQGAGYGGGYSYAPRPAYRPWRPRPVYYGGYRPRSYYGYSQRRAYSNYAPRPAYTSYRPRANYGYGYRQAPRVQYGISQFQHRGYGRPLRRMY